MKKINEIKIVGFIIVIIILCYLIYLIVDIYVPKQQFCSSDNFCRTLKEYNYNDEESGRLLTKLSEYSQLLKDHLAKKYLKTNNYSNEKIINKVKRLLDKFDPNIIIENKDVENPNKSTYTLNKGEKIAMCLNKWESPYKENWNTLQHVLTHELAHIMTNNYGHDDTFWESFKFLLQEASEAGLYTPLDYSLQPIEFCGASISYNPYFDNNVKFPVN